MLKRRVNSPGQSITEYIVLIGLVSMAIIGMQVYMKRGIQAAIKLSADELGSQTIQINTIRDIWSYSGSNQSDSGTVNTQVASEGVQTRNINTTTTSNGYGGTWQWQENW
jgi:Flp pilus assembly pilin Flp